MPYFAHKGEFIVIILEKIACILLKLYSIVSHAIRQYNVFITCDGPTTKKSLHLTTGQVAFLHRIPVIQHDFLDIVASWDS